MTTAKFYTRQPYRNGFRYYDHEKIITDKKILERITKLVIPPAWTDVEIACSSRARIQARGYDAAGRLQAIYHPAFRERQERLKYDRMLRFGCILPQLRRQVNRDLSRRRLSKERVLACIVTLIDRTYLRVGNDRYAKMNHSYGITTLRSKHVEIKGDTIIFDFIGKSGKQHVKKISDRQLCRLIKQLDELPGYELFRYQDKNGAVHDLHSHDVNEYIKLYMGEEFTAKDFRTWHGTVIASEYLLSHPPAASLNERKKEITAAVKRVAKALGNTPALARASYIDPRVLATYLNPNQFTKLAQKADRLRATATHSRAERQTIALLGD